MAKRKPTTDAVEILHHLYVKDDPEMQRMLEAERVKSKIARQVYDLRESAGLTQQQLAEKVGTTIEMIDNLEEADYEDHEIGNTILILHRIAKVLDKQVEFRIVPLGMEPTIAKPKPQSAIS